MSSQVRFDGNQKKTLDLEGRVPPQNLEAERSLLGCILLVSESLDEVGEIIHVDHFYSDAHQKIFRAAQELYEKGTQGIDAVTIAEVLSAHNQLEDVGGPPLPCCVDGNGSTRRSRSLLRQHSSRKIAPEKSDLFVHRSAQRVLRFQCSGCRFAGVSRNHRSFVFSNRRI